MLRDSETGATFAPDEIGWIDFESANKVNDIKVGAYRYACDADAVIAAYAIGDGPVRTVEVTYFPQTLTWADMPDEFKAHHDRVLSGKAVWAAWNAAFDKAIWNYSAIDWPRLEPHHIIDVMAQAVASGLAPDMRMAAIQCGAERKDEAGKELIRMFCMPYQENAKTGRPIAGYATPQTHPQEWDEFCNYASNDPIAMRSVFKHTRQLPWAEWEQYWAGELINERGIGIDLKMITHAAVLAEQDRIKSRARLRTLTNNAVGSVDEVAKITKWLLSKKFPKAVKLLTKRVEEIDEETGDVVKPPKHSLTRKRVEKLIIAVREDKELPESVAEAMLEVLQIRLYGGSKTPMKFSRALQQHIDSVLMGQYVFNGAPQTGRYSSRGVQVHNLARDVVKSEPDLINALLHGCSYETFAKLGSKEAVSRKLSLLIRPALVPQPDKVFVWSDWSQIEARVLPWLAGDDPDAETRLQIFRDVDADPRVPDLYTRTASDLSGLPISEITKPLRQRGKVAELALGFMGGANALQNMAAAYGMEFDDSEAKDIVFRWREANPWAGRFADALWEAAREAHHFPDNFVPAGRVGFIFLKNYLKGSLLMRLPSGRFLTYRALKWEDVDIEDEDGEPTGEKETLLRYGRGYGRQKLWAGIFSENATQATAADILRGTLVRLEDLAALEPDFMPTRLHTHDEILTEASEDRAEEAVAALGDIMRRGFDWSEGLPIMSDETIGDYYSKDEDSYLIDTPWGRQPLYLAAEQSGVPCETIHKCRKTGTDPFQRKV
jgi:DNA polymerase